MKLASCRKLLRIAIVNPQVANLQLRCTCSVRPYRSLVVLEIRQLIASMEREESRSRCTPELMIFLENCTPARHGASAAR